MNSGRLTLRPLFVIGLLFSTSLMTSIRALDLVPGGDLVTAPQYPPTNVVTGYPQPFNTTLHVQVKGYDGKPIVIELRQTMSGTPVLQQAVTYNGPVHLNTASLPNGWYILAATFQGRVIGMREVQKAQVH